MFAGNTSQDLEKLCFHLIMRIQELGKKEVATALMMAALEKYCVPVAVSSSRNQISHLQKAGYSEGDLAEIAESLVSELKKRKSE